MILFRIIGVFWLSISSMFSYGSNVSCESSYCEESKELEIRDSSLQEKGAFVVNGYEMYIGFSEFGSFPYYRAFIQNLENFDYIYNTNITLAQFKGGTPIDVAVDFHMGNMSNGVFDWQWSINHLRIELDTSRSQEDRIIWKFTENGGGTFNLEARYVYYDSLKLDCIMNEVRVINGNTTTGWLNLCFTYNIFNYRTLLPTSYSDMDANVAYRDGYYTGYGIGYENGSEDGYQQGLVDGGNTNPMMNSIFSGIFQVGLLPVNVFLTLFNYEVFGINISGFISGLLTIAVIVIIFRFLFGGGKSDK